MKDVQEINYSSSQLDPDEILISGGLQQLLIKNMTCQQPSLGKGSDVTTFHDLADSIQLHIFSFLCARDLCISSMVCRHWYSITSDEILWKQKLAHDVLSWGVVSHTTYPETYRTKLKRLISVDSVKTDPTSAAGPEESSEQCTAVVEWTSKEIYLRCSPVVGQLSKQSNYGFHLLSSIFRSIWPKKVPRLAMFGPGLETSTSFIVTKILESASGLFTKMKMFPGTSGGVGSGFTLKMSPSGVTLDLITLYTATQEEREARSQEQRARNNKLMSSNNAAAAGEEQTFELQPHVKELCRSLNGFVFVLDVTLPPESIELCRAEMFAMCNEQWAPAGAPLLVLACVPLMHSVRTLNCVSLVECLRLQKIGRPWQIQNCVVDTMSGVLESFQWLVQTSQRS